MPIHANGSGALPDHVSKTIQDATEKIRQREEETRDDKRALNKLCTMYGIPPVYEDKELLPTETRGPIRSDQYFGQPLAKVVKEILDRRRTANLGPASVAAIYSEMVAGGYQFDAKDEENAKRGLRISLSKNTALFLKLPNGEYGL